MTTTPKREITPQERAQWGRRLVSIEKAAAYVDTTPRTIRRAIAEGKFSGYRFGKRMIRVDLNEVDAALKIIPTAGPGAA